MSADQITPWGYCPECGSEEVRYEEGTHKQCGKCGQEWYSDIDYTDTVQQNLADVVSLRADVQRLTERNVSMEAEIRILTAEARRSGAGRVEVPVEEWEVIEEILKVSAICANDGGTDRKCCMQTDDHHIPLTRLRALRSSTNHDSKETP